MNRKHQTPLGYLMALLGVSLKDLSDYLYVAQTSISKWKTGARVLRPESQHFAGIVEYFTMLTRDVERRTKLAHLFSRLYPAAPLEKPKELSACIRAFLSGKQLPSAMVRQEIGDSDDLYTAQVSIYRGEQGEAAALRQFWAHLAEQPPMKLWACSRADMAPLSGYAPMLAQGHRLSLLMEPFAVPQLAFNLSSLLAHANADVRMLPGGIPLPPFSACHVAEKALLLWTYANPSHARYAALYTDPLTVGQARVMLERLWDDAAPVFTRISRERVQAADLEQTLAASLPERLDWLLPSLPFITMNPELLMEVLRANSVSGRVWAYALAEQRAMDRLPVRLFVPAASLTVPQQTLPMLSMLCGKQIHLTEAQAARHMLDTAAALRAGDRITLVPVQETQEPERVCSFVLRNVFGGYMDPAGAGMLLTRHPRMVESLMGAMDALAQRATQEIMQPGYVAGLLERVALGGVHRAER